ISVTPDDDLRTAQVQNERVQAAIIHAAYIGPRKKHEAEEFVAKPTSFKVYHRVCGRFLMTNFTQKFQLPNMLSLGDIRPDLPLFIVYRSGRGKIHHYAVNETRIYEWKGNQLTPMSSFQVEYGDPAAPRFFTLESLIQFYTTYVHLRQTKGGESIADIFPRLRSSRRTCRERIADVE
ncbi:unnamed protein product, partial [Toxocara canis]|uniref:SH2 domain-containing protein n=1 Tax=Toxocara canis TaxID=6265 RepID=A0A183TX30_TOXCA